ncbi:transcriptional repressor [bacterium]|nr:transcriptional repressor [bacterium]MBU1636885.1 transcriptional repressor [bacterium]MBU1919809.1 transcriptional repressor [bacterium]
MQRNTRQRKAILKVLQKADHPLSSQEVMEQTVRNGDSLNIATVYRTLSAFVKRGTLVEVRLPGESKRYELSGKTHHHHFRCRKCNRVLVIEKCADDLPSLVPDGYVLENHDLFLYGLCAECAPNKKKRA